MRWSPPSPRSTCCLGSSDLRFNWVVARLDRLDPVTMEERVCDAWAMCVPKFLVRERLVSCVVSSATKSSLRRWHGLDGHRLR